MVTVWVIRTGFAWEQAKSAPRQRGVGGEGVYPRKEGEEEKEVGKEGTKQVPEDNLQSYKVYSSRKLASNCHPNTWEAGGLL